MDDFAYTMGSNENTGYGSNVITGSFDGAATQSEIPETRGQEVRQNVPDFDFTDSESFMKQIDEFRTRAMEISKIIGQKENKVRDLERQVQVKENENRELESSLSKKREEAENINNAVNTQVERLVRRLEENQDDMSEDLSHTISLSSSEVKNSINTLQGSLDQKFDAFSQEMRNNMEGIRSGIGQELSGVSNVKDDLQGTISEIKESIETTLQGQNEEVKTTLAGFNDGMDSMKNELSEKVHSENVKVYRNIQDLLKELDQSEEQRILLETHVGKLKNQNMFLTFLAAVNLGVGIILVLLNLGIL